MSDDLDGEAKLDARDDRRLHRWPAVIVGLAAALVSVALGSWWLALAIVGVALGFAIWALLS